MEYDIDDYDDIDRTTLNSKNERDVEMAREYCDEHESAYKEDTCEPIWKKDGELDKYMVEMHESRKAQEEFIKKRNNTANHTPKQYKRK